MDRKLRTTADALSDPRLTEDQLSILQHALGLDKYGQGQMYRNHFCAGGKDEDVCRELVAMGLMRVFAPNASPLPYYNCAITVEGIEAMRRESPKPPKLTRAQKRYREWLRVSDLIGFGDWLKRRHYA